MGRLGLAAVGLLWSVPAMAQQTPVGAMLSASDVGAIVDDLKTWGVAILAVSLTISALFLAKKLIVTLCGGGCSTGGGSGGGGGGGSRGGWERDYGP